MQNNSENIEWDILISKLLEELEKVKSKTEILIKEVEKTEKEVSLCISDLAK